jgi:chemotaxis signal transduction protein
MSGPFVDESRLEPGLECVVADQRLVIPSVAVQQIIEYEVTALPLTREQIGGVGVHAGTVVISLRLCGWSVPQQRCRSAKGVLLGVAGRPTRWVVEVSDIVAFVEAVPDRGTSRAWTCKATLRDGRSVSWLDVDALLRELEAKIAERQVA